MFFLLKIQPHLKTKVDREPAQGRVRNSVFWGSSKNDNMYLSQMKVDIFLSHIIHLSLTLYRVAHMHPLVVLLCAPTASTKMITGAVVSGVRTSVRGTRWGMPSGLDPNNPMGKMQVFIP